MKRLVLLLAAVALPTAMSAQTATPAQIAYQGHVRDASGVAIGDTTPVNREIIFRVYDNPTAGNRLYSEKQTVTISKGEFSVLLGQGTAVAGETNTGTLEAIFTANIAPAVTERSRYLGLTVDDGTATVDPEISPRQQLVTAPFAFRAKVAEGVLNQGITGAMIGNSQVSTSQLADNAVTGAKLVANAVDSAKIVDGTILAADIGAGQVSAAKLGTDVGQWTVTGANIWRGSHVGIATASPAALLSLGGNPLNTKLLVMDDGNAGNNMGFGAQANQFRFHVGNSAAKFSFLNAAAGTEFLTLLGNGNVGVGLTTPQHPLVVFNATHARMAFQHDATSTASEDGLHVGSHPAASYVWNKEATALQLGTNNTERMRIEPDGRMAFNGSVGGTMGYIMRSPNMQYILWIQDRNGTLNFAFEEGGQAHKAGTSTSWTVTSDRRLKTNIADRSGSLNKLLQLRSVTFDFKDERRAKGRQTGFIAQEVQEVYPQWVSTNPEGFLGVGFSGFEAEAVQALRELRAEKDDQIAALQAQVKELKGENATAAQRLEALEQRMNAMAKPLADARSNR